MIFPHNSFTGAKSKASCLLRRSSNYFLKLNPNLPHKSFMVDMMEEE